EEHSPRRRPRGDRRCHAKACPEVRLAPAWFAAADIDLCRREKWRLGHAPSPRGRAKTAACASALADNDPRDPGGTSRSRDCPCPYPDPAPRGCPQTTKMPRRLFLL